MIVPYFEIQEKINSSKKKLRSSRESAVQGTQPLPAFLLTRKDVVMNFIIYLITGRLPERLVAGNWN